MWYLLGLSPLWSFQYLPPSLLTVLWMLLTSSRWKEAITGVERRSGWWWIHPPSSACFLTWQLKVRNCPRLAFRFTFHPTRNAPIIPCTVVSSVLPNICWFSVIIICRRKSTFFNSHFNSKIEIFTEKNTTSETFELIWTKHEGSYLLLRCFLV